MIHNNPPSTANGQSADPETTQRERWRICHSEADRLAKQGETEQAFALLDTIISEATAAGDDEVRYHSQVFYGMVLTTVGQIERAYKLLSDALPYYEAKENNDLGTILGTIGNIFRMRGLIEDALANYNRAFAIFEKTGNIELLISMKGNIGGVFSERGRFADAEPVLRETIQIALDNASYSNAIGYLTDLARIMLSTNRVDDALVVLQEAKTYLPHAVSTRAKGLLFSAFGIAFGMKNEWHSALEANEIALEVYRRLGERRLLGITLMNSAQSFLALNDIDSAEANIRESLEIHRQMQNFRSLAFSLTNLAAIVQYRGNLEEAYHILHEALKLFQNLQYPIETGIISSTIGRLLTETGELGEAKSHHEQALTYIRSTKNRSQYEMVLLRNMETSVIMRCWDDVARIIEEFQSIDLPSITPPTYHAICMQGWQHLSNWLQTGKTPEKRREVLSIFSQIVMELPEANWGIFHDSATSYHMFRSELLRNGFTEEELSFLQQANLDKGPST
ncbi:MAG: tetratricopeptide repeat protein [bacterium]|nr:tetratricopeptide repeat protein [bacterium]